jgi:hypothetical protein
LNRRPTYSGQVRTSSEVERTRKEETSFDRSEETAIFEARSANSPASPIQQPKDKSSLDALPQAPAQAVPLRRLRVPYRGKTVDLTHPDETCREFAGYLLSLGADDVLALPGTTFTPIAAHQVAA